MQVCMYMQYHKQAPGAAGLSSQSIVGGRSAFYATEVVEPVFLGMISKNNVQWFFLVSEKIDVFTAFSGGRLQERNPLIRRLYYLGLVSAYAGLEATLILVNIIFHDN